MQDAIGYLVLIGHVVGYAIIGIGLLCTCLLLLALARFDRNRRSSARRLRISQAGLRDISRLFRQRQQMPRKVLVRIAADLLLERDRLPLNRF